MARPGFWDDQARARQTVQALATAKARLERFDDLTRRAGDALALAELASEEADPSIAAELRQELGRLRRDVRHLELETLLNGPYDRHSAILALHAGAGGTDAQDWVEMLYRMYIRWAEDHGYRLEVLDMVEGEEAGLKSVTLLVEGDNAYGFLRAERGVHRLVRHSPFDYSARRHTSFASVDVIPDLPEDGEIEIDPEDLRVDTFRASGAGGQHVNKTSSAVRLTHLPTGIVVTCQNERSQHANRETAMRILKARLLKLREEEREKELAQLRGEHREIAWGSQIRSYVFDPYTLVKDHRTGVEVGNIRAVMDGELDPFIYSFLEAERSRVHQGGTPPGGGHGGGPRPG